MNHGEGCSPFSKLVQNFLVPSSPGGTLEKILKSVSDSEAKVQALAPIFLENQLYEQYLLRLDLLQERITQWSSEQEGNPQKDQIILERILGLMGRLAIRNSAASVRVNRIAGQGLPRKAADHLVLSQSDLLRYAFSSPGIL